MGLRASDRLKYCISKSVVINCFEDKDVLSFLFLASTHLAMPSSLHSQTPHLVLGIHLGHHAVLQQVEGEHLQHVQLVGHLIVNGCGAPDHILHGVEDKQREKSKRRGWQKSRGERSGGVRCAKRR